jgi:hypothetical protein
LAFKALYLRLKNMNSFLSNNELPLSESNDCYSLERDSFEVHEKDKREENTFLNNLEGVTSYHIPGYN